MGDSENREKIEYTPEELQEIDRIIGVVSSARVKPDARAASVPPRPEYTTTSVIDRDSEMNIGEPDDLDLPSESLNDLGDNIAYEAAESGEEFMDSGEESELPAMDIPESDFLSSGEDEESPLEDITDLIQEVESPEYQEEGGTFAAGLTEDLPAEGAGAEMSPLSELDELAQGSLDLGDLADEGYMGLSGEDSEEISGLDEGSESGGAGLSFAGDDADIPDLSEISLDESPAIPEAQDLDIPDIDLGEPAGFEEDQDEEGPAFDGSGSVTDEIEDIDIGSVMDEEPQPAAKPMDLEIEPADDMDSPVRSTEMDDDFAIEPLEETEAPARKPALSAERGDEAIDLSEKELKKMKKALILFNPGLRAAIKDTVINDRLPNPDIRELVDMILSGRPEEKVRNFLEEKLGRSIPVVSETGGAGRRVIHSRPEYTREGRERQKKLLKTTKIAAVAALGAFMVTVLSYQFIYKPVMAKRTIGRGVELILKPGDYTEKPKDYEEAERLANYVEEHYRENYLYGYNQYGMAYLKKKEYVRTYKKLNTAYKLAPRDIDTLLNLGYFYAKVPAEIYRLVEDSVEKNYYPPEALKGRKMSQLDVAINFYKRVLTIDKKNVKALHGIGNAYFSQREYLKAKKYYMDILAVDDRSVEGYSGLLNLYIERDAYDLVASTHTEIRYKKLLADLPSPLLAKLAHYYLMKKKTDSFNARIDHSVQSPRLKDVDDNTYPAVESVLSALNKKDSNYPPLMVMEARLNMAKKNLTVAERYLKRALDREPNYFAALHLMGKYYYEVRQPVKAYEYLTKAVKAYASPPDFTTEDFYKETENVGESYAITGDIFYYFFDKVRFRYGDLSDELIDGETEKMVNYSVAREKYETAAKEGFESSEMHYNLGRIYYINHQYDRALDQWLHLYDDFVDSPELMFALGNAFYHLGNYEASKGEYLKLINVSENDADDIKTPDPGKGRHDSLFRSLSSSYNNIGAVYQKQNNESKSSVSYWKSIDYAKRISIENEFARVNLARSLNRLNKAEPILDENIPYSVKFYREDMRN